MFGRRYAHFFNTSVNVSCFQIKPIARILLHTLEALTQNCSLEKSLYTSFVQFIQPRLTLPSAACTSECHFAKYLEVGNHIFPRAARDATAVELFLGYLLDLSEAFITLSWDSPVMACQCKWSPKITDTSKCMTFTMHSLSESSQIF